MPERLRVTPLGGLGEIGLNCLMLEAGGERLLIDAGMMLPWGNGYGIDVVIPDFAPACRGPEELVGLVLTHGHEDHIGAAPYLLLRRDLPVYGPPLALALLRERLEEFELVRPPRLIPLAAGEPVSLGPFDIEGIDVRHSIPDSLGLAVETPAGLVVHSGDFKLDDSDVGGPPTDLARFAEIGRRGVLALFSDSTNATHPGRSGSEAEAARVIEGLVSAAPGRVFVAAFASHLYRLRMLTRLAAKYGRRVVFSGRSLQTNVRVARELTGWGLGRDVEVSEAEAADLDPDQVLVITTGSQGEPLSALFRMAVGQHKYFKARPGDLVILSARRIPGHERTVDLMINRLLRRGADVIYGPGSGVHVSGHAAAEELTTLIEAVRPRSFVPIHGEYRHLLAHARLAEKAGLTRDRVVLAENGQVIEFRDGRAGLFETVPAGRTLVDGKGVGDIEGPVMRSRRRMGAGGVVVVVALVDDAARQILMGPQLVNLGFVGAEAENGLWEETRALVTGIIEEAGADLAWDEVGDLIRRQVGRFFTQAIDRRPVIETVLIPI